MTETQPSGVRACGLVWLGQLISSVGSGLTGFALGVWVFQKTGSVTQFTAISFFGALPGPAGRSHGRRAREAPSRWGSTTGRPGTGEFGTLSNVG